MNSLFKRVLAYLIDMLLVSIVVSSIGSYSGINKQLDAYNDNYTLYIETIYLYSEQSNLDISTCEEFEQAINDEDLTEEEYITQYEEIKDEEDYDNLCQELVDDYNNHKMTEEEYNDSINTYYYKVMKNYEIVNIINIIICLLYFVLFQGFTKGQTLGKKIMRIKVVSRDSKNITYKQLFIRSLFLYSIIYYLAMTICSFALSQDSFITASNILYNLNYVLQLVIVLTIGLTKERLGLHDIVAKTKVVMLDFKGNIIEEKPIFNFNKKSKKKEDSK